MPKHYHTCLLMNALLALRPCLVSHQCRCVLQRLSVADFKRPCLKPLGVQLRASMPALEKGWGSVARSSRANYVGIVNVLVVFMVVLLSIPIPSHRTTPSKTALSHSLFVGRGACPSLNIIVIIINNSKEIQCKKELHFTLDTWKI